ncbi:DMT family transporter [Arthrobacter tumbae]|uniref:DMT family transporter n=1 Tax=Arthrobacter tumbae TaxID=163874 RepID=UPI00195C1960|nr:DMT family transporter [Arthrobacter tumbae]MBM7779971.1 drug/metabolite transporter (DMT)-like permease [Arthrobacter tumbae]
MNPPSGASLVLRFAVLALAWGCSFLFIKVALEGLSPSQVVLGRVLIGAITLGLVVSAGRVPLPRGARVWGHLLVVGLFLCVVPFTLFAAAETSIPSGLASIYNATTPLLTALVAILALPGERLSRRAGAGLAVGFLGVLVVVGLPVGAQTGNDESLAGQLMCLGATACYGIGFVWIRRFISPLGLPAASVAFVQVGLGAVVALVLAPFTALQPMTLTPPVVLSVIALGALSTGLAYIWNTEIVAGWGATSAASVTYLTPVVGVIAGVLVLDESFSWNQPAGGVLVVLGVVMTKMPLRRIRRAPRPNPDREQMRGRSGYGVQ